MNTLRLNPTHWVVFKFVYGPIYGGHIRVYIRDFVIFLYTNFFLVTFLVYIRVHSK